MFCKPYRPMKTVVDVAAAHSDQSDSASTSRTTPAQTLVSAGARPHPTIDHHAPWRERGRRTGRSAPYTSLAQRTRSRHFTRYRRQGFLRRKTYGKDSKQSFINEAPGLQSNYKVDIEERVWGSFSRKYQTKPMQSPAFWWILDLLSARKGHVYYSLHQRVRQQLK